MSRRIASLLVLAALSLAMAAPAQAVLITVNFSVTGNNALDLANQGVTSNGSFTFDSSLIPAGGGTPAGPFPYESSISFSWDGTTWTSANADVTYLAFDAQGQLTAWRLGGSPSTSSAIGAFANADDVQFNTDNLASFSYTHQGNTVNVFGVTGMTWTVDYGQTGGNGDTGGSAPEPTTWMLLLGGVLGAMSIRRRGGDR